ncbi:MAG: tRNA lysidine(34) synthetase TilS [Acholeplasmataceae bacterium]|jgi:tRNA(Ile)-lysidine synthase|nr:tRNA lysidine(34) synthetase TilS [Acholeplasmataceae bacterium]
MINLQNVLKNNLHIPNKFPLIVSVSGGVDSMTLISLLLETTYKPIVVHFNHLKRDESIIEKDLVESFCKEKNIVFYYYTIDVAEGNFHHQAHTMRKHYLTEVAKLHKTPYILTAHHLDDLFENVLIKLTRGSNLLGYAGMQPYHESHGFIYVKPLLYVPKKVINDYAIKFNVPYLDDSSNEDNYYLRNRYRHAIVPIMKQENEDLLEQIKQYHLQVSHAFKFIRETTKKHVNQHFEINVNEYAEQPDAIQEDIIAYLLEQNKLSFTYETLQKIRRMLISKRPNQTYSLENKLKFVKAYDKAYIQPLSIQKQSKIMVKEGKNKLTKHTIFTFFPISSDLTEEFIKLCYNELAFPLWLRPREDGDILSYDYGHKKLKKLLIDKKVPMNERNQLWVLTDNNDQVLWVEKYYLNQTLGNDNSCYFQLKGETNHA